MSGREEHDRLFPPWRGDETSDMFLLRALREHRQSHLDWVEHMKACIGCSECRALSNVVGELEYQEAAVARYDEMIEAVRRLYARAIS